MSKVVVASDLDGRCLVSLILWLRSPKKIGENQFDFSDRKMTCAQTECIGDYYEDGPIARVAAAGRALEVAMWNDLVVVENDSLGTVTLSEQGRNWNYEFEVVSE